MFPGSWGAKKVTGAVRVTEDAFQASTATASTSVPKYVIKDAEGLPWQHVSLADGKRWMKQYDYPVKQAFINEAHIQLPPVLLKIKGIQSKVDALFKSLPPTVDELLTKTDKIIFSERLPQDLKTTLHKSRLSTLNLSAIYVPEAYREMAYIQAFADPSIPLHKQHETIAAAAEMLREYRAATRERYATEKAAAQAEIGRLSDELQQYPEAIQDKVHAAISQHDVWNAEMAALTRMIRGEEPGLQIPLGERQAVRHEIEERQQQAIQELPDSLTYKKTTYNMREMVRARLDARTRRDDIEFSSKRLNELIDVSEKIVNYEGKELPDKQSKAIGQLWGHISLVNLGTELLHRVEDTAGTLDERLKLMEKVFDELREKIEDLGFLPVQLQQKADILDLYQGRAQGIVDAVWASTALSPERHITAEAREIAQEIDKGILKRDDTPEAVEKRAALEKRMDDYEKSKEKAPEELREMELRELLPPDRDDLSLADDANHLHAQPPKALPGRGGLQDDILDALEELQERKLWKLLLPNRDDLSLAQLRQTAIETVPGLKTIRGELRIPEPAVREVFVSVGAILGKPKAFKKTLTDFKLELEKYSAELPKKDRLENLNKNMRGSEPSSQQTADKLLRRPRREGAMAYRPFIHGREKD